MKFVVNELHLPTDDGKWPFFAFFNPIPDAGMILQAL